MEGKLPETPMPMSESSRPSSAILTAQRHKDGGRKDAPATHESPASHMSSD